MVAIKDLKSLEPFIRLIFVLRLKYAKSAETLQPCSFDFLIKVNIPFYRKKWITNVPNSTSKQPDSSKNMDEWLGETEPILIMERLNIRTDLREHGPLIFRDQKVPKKNHQPYNWLQKLPLTFYYFLKYPLKSSRKISPDVPIFLHFYQNKLVIPSLTQLEGMMTQLELMHCTMAYEPGCWADRKGVWSEWPSYLSINYSVNGACL